MVAGLDIVTLVVRRGIETPHIQDPRQNFKIPHRNIFEINMKSLYPKFQLFSFKKLRGEARRARQARPGKACKRSFDHLRPTTYLRQRPYYDNPISKASYKISKIPLIRIFALF